jgi:hypothetical protein
MKNLFFAVALFLATFAPAHAFWNYGGTLVDQAITYSQDFNSVEVDDARVVSVQAIWSTATVPTATFTDGSKSTGSFTVSTITYTGARININGVSVIQGIHWSTAASVGLMAKSLSDAIMANASLNTIVSSTWNISGVVTTTATAVGVNAYELLTTTPAAVSVSGAAMTGGAASPISSSAETITKAYHGMATALGVRFDTVSGTAPGGLTSGVTDYAIVPNINTIKLATTSTGAIAGVALDIGSQTGGGSFTLTPMAFAGTPSFKIQVSNDASSWFDLNVASITYSAPGNYLWDLGQPSYRFMRVKYIHGSNGVFNLDMKAVGR